MKVKGSPNVRTMGRGKRPETRPELLKGQVWKASDTYILITEVGKLLIHYRVGSRPNIHTTPARISSKQDVQAYLERHDGVLLKGAP